MTDNIKGAFLRVSHSCVQKMGARLAQLKALVIDMSAPFGWTARQLTMEFSEGPYRGLTGASRHRR